MDYQQPLEFTGEDVKTAIAAGLEELGVGPDDVLVEVLEEPSRGVFGIGARKARVSLKLLRPPQPAPVEQQSSYDEQSDNSDVDDDETDYDDVPEAPYAEEDLEDDARIGREVLSDLVGYLGIEADVIIRRADLNRAGENAPWLLDVTGPDMSLLIGRRGETLNALQYITRLITSRRLQRRANIIVDAGGYKSRRSKRLRELATRMADQAVRTQRTVTMEPMPPNERRIIHLELRSRQDVETNSTGEGDSRKVMIIPK